MTTWCTSATYLGRIPDYDHILTRLGIPTVDNKIPYTSHADVIIPCKTGLLHIRNVCTGGEQSFGHEGQIIRQNVGGSHPSLRVQAIVLLNKHSKTAGSCTDARGGSSIRAAKILKKNETKQPNKILRNSYRAYYYIQNINQIYTQ